MQDLAEYRNKPIAFIRAMYRPYWGWLLLTVITYEVYHVFSFFTGYPLKLLIDKAPSFTNWSEGLSIIWILVGIFLVMDVALRLVRFFWIALEKRIRLDVGKKLIEYTLNHGVDYFSKRMAGSIVNRNLTIFSSMNSIIEDVVVYGIFPGITSIIVALAIFSSLNPLLVTIFLVWVIPFIVIVYLLTKPLGRVARIKAETQSAYVGKLSDTISNQSIIKFFSGEQTEYDRLSPSLLEATKAWMKEIKVWEWSQFARNTCVLILYVAVYISLIHLYLQKQITLGDIAFSVGIIMTAADTIKTATMSISSYFSSRGVLEDNLNDLLEPHAIKDEDDAPSLVATEGRIDVEKVTFSYSQKEPVLKDFSLHIPGKQRIGIVGTSGAGKSTLLSILLRLYPVQEGKVTIDGEDIASVSQESLRKSISFIPQDSTLFHRSIRENILYGKENATEEEIIQAAKLAQAHEFITKLPNGYDSVVGERGVLLSGGQRQRIAIARAFIKYAPILIMDEATSALDSESEAAIQKALEELIKDKTVIIVAHRLSTLLIMDRLVVLEDGKIVEDGTHKGLLQQKGVYASLWNRQTGNFLGDKLLG